MHALLKSLGTRAVLFSVLAIMLAGCGGGSSGTTAAQPGVPVIANLVSGYRLGTCAQGRAGRPLAATVNYADSDGDVTGGTLKMRATFHPSEQSFDLDFGLPSSSATITGTTNGSITAFACATLGSRTTGFTVSVAVLDKAGNLSNILSAEFSTERSRVPGIDGAAEADMEKLRP